MGSQIVLHTESLHAVATFEVLYQRNWNAVLLSGWTVVLPWQIAVYHIDGNRLNHGDPRIIVPPYLYRDCIPKWAANAVLGVGLTKNPAEDEVALGALEELLGAYQNWIETKEESKLPWKGRRLDSHYSVLIDLRRRAREVFQQTAK